MVANMCDLMVASDDAYFADSTCLLLVPGPGGIGRDLCALAASTRPAPLIAPTVTAEDPHRLSYSGGTTGRPKAVVGSSGGEISDTHPDADLIRPGGALGAHNWLPMAYSVRQFIRSRANIEQ